MDAPEIGILGAGAFGTALAVALGQGGRRVALWARDPLLAEAMQRERSNAARLPGATLPAQVSPTASLADALAAPVILLAVPTQQLRALCSQAAEGLAGKPAIACCKGVELGTGLLPTEIIAACAPGARAGVLTGPSFAADIAQGKPTALTLALEGPEGAAVQELLSTRNLRLYLSHDLIGAQMGGALKNVIAIAAGICIGADLGESARAALMTRGMAEMARLAQGRGAQPETLWGLSGFGDLVLTCTSQKSRNFSHGLAIGAGAAPDATKTVEGVMTAHALAQTAQGADLPITSMVSALLRGEVDLEQAKTQLLSRPLRREIG
ncbi:MAG: NAD(P)H-dependent glycerol-3-phosphate dehydrogenase [Paracoccaceae bacterium]